MNFDVLSRILPAQKILELQKVQRLECLLLSDIVPASGSSLGRVAIANNGSFNVKFITGHFTTLKLATGDIVDDGVCHLRGQLKDSNGNRLIFNDYTPLDMFLTPGRERSPLATNNLLTTAKAAVATLENALFEPMALDCYFEANSDIQFECKNDSDTPNSYEIMFWGIRFPGIKK